MYRSGTCTWKGTHVQALIHNRLQILTFIDPLVILTSERVKVSHSSHGDRPLACSTNFSGRNIPVLSCDQVLHVLCLLHTEVEKKFQASSWGRKLAKQANAKSMTDFDRFRCAGSTHSAAERQARINLMRCNAVHKPF